MSVIRETQRSIRHRIAEILVFAGIILAAFLILTTLTGCLGCQFGDQYAANMTNVRGRNNTAAQGSQGVASNVNDHGRGAAPATDYYACADAAIPADGDRPARVARSTGGAAVTINGDALQDKTIDAKTTAELMKNLRNAATAQGGSRADADIDDRDTLTPTLNIPVAGPGAISSVQPGGGGSKSGLAEFVTEKARALFDGKDKDKDDEDCTDCVPSPD